VNKRIKIFTKDSLHSPRGSTPQQVSTDEDMTHANDDLTKCLFPPRKPRRPCSSPAAFRRHGTSMRPRKTSASAGSAAEDQIIDKGRR
jgi:hypothetical protein